MINLLEKMLAGNLSSGEALEAWPNTDDASDNKLMQNAWHSLYHYDVDEDNAPKDPKRKA